MKRPGDGATADILARLKGVRRSGEGWTAKCPAHSDRQNSLSVHRRDGKWLLKCHAGCDWDAVLAAANIAPSDLFDSGNGKRANYGKNYPPINRATAQLPGLTLDEYAAAKALPVGFLQECGLSDAMLTGRSVVRIPYFGAGGEELALRFRVALAGDRFRWKSGSKPCLYGLNRIGDAQSAGYTVLVEGESDVHTLWQHGTPAVGLPGAASWRENRDANRFDGIDAIYIVIEPDKGGDTVRKWLAKSKIRDRTKLVQLNGFKDPSALYLDDPARFGERWRAALDAAVPWRDEFEREREEARNAAWKECGKLAQCSDILSEMAQLVRKHGLVGEERIAMLLYLAVTSRVLTRIVSLAIKGPSSGGKSFLVETVLRLFPPEAFYVLTAMSDHALAYGEESLAHKIIVLYEAAGLTGDFGTYLVRSLLSEGRICYETVEKTKEGLKARRIERDGPTGLITTTTAVGLHPENETRLLSVTVTDTSQQTKLIMRAHAQGRGRTNSIDIAPWHALQRALAFEEAKVVIPFSEDLADLIPAVAVRLRRDFPTVLSLIEAHALLHQAVRERSSDGTVIATYEDYTAIRELVADLVSQGVGATVSSTLRETVRAVEELQSEAGADGVSMTVLGQRLQLDKSSTSRRAKDAIAKGYLKNLEDKRGRPARLVIGDPLPEEITVLPTLPLLQTKCCAIAPPQQGVQPPRPPEAVEEATAWTV